MTHDMKIAAVVVTFNRKELLKECLDALLNQTRPLDSIILIDNASTDGTPEFLRKHGYLENNIIDYVRLKENTGGAGGFYYGVKRGHEKGFDWLWLMDDDAEPTEDSLEILLQGLLEINDDNIGALASVVVDKNGDICKLCRGYLDIKQWHRAQEPVNINDIRNKRIIKIDFASFVGILISKKVVRIIGYPFKDFFIYHDDLEYCFRINKISNIYLVCNSTILHKTSPDKIFSKKIFLTREYHRKSLQRHLLNCIGLRNIIYLNKLIKKKIPFFNIIAYSIKRTVGILIFDDKKLLRIKLLWKMILDGIQSNFDNYIIKEIIKNV